MLVNAARGIAKEFGVLLPKSMTSTCGKRASADLPERFAHSRDVAGFLGLRPTQRRCVWAQAAPPHPIPRLAEPPGAELPPPSPD